VLVPEFALTKTERDNFVDKGVFTKKIKGKFSSETVNYYVLPPSKEGQFFTEMAYINEQRGDPDPKARSFALKATSMAFTLMKQIESAEGKTGMLSCIIGLYSVSPTNAERLMSLFRSKIYD